MKILYLGIAILLLSSYLHAEDGTAEQYTFAGVIVSQNSERISGTGISFKNGETMVYASTDVDGKFSIKLPAGNYTMTVNGVPETTFRGFINISASGMNPQNVDFTVDPSSSCPSDQPGSTLPKILKSVTPIFPAAVRAVRAGGTVGVQVWIDKGGKVVKATAISGHPLLKNASTVAARKFEFSEGSDETERKVTLEFAFLDGEPDANLKIYRCSYRILVYSPHQTIQF